MSEIVGPQEKRERVPRIYPRPHITNLRVHLPFGRLRTEQRHHWVWGRTKRIRQACQTWRRLRYFSGDRLAAGRGASAAQGISPQAARISEDRRAVVRVPCRLCGDRDGGGLYSPWALDSSRHCTAGDRAGSVAEPGPSYGRARGGAAGVAGDRADRAVVDQADYLTRGPLRPGLQDEQFSPANGLRRQAQGGADLLRSRWRLSVPPLPFERYVPGGFIRYMPADEHRPWQRGSGRLSVMQ